MKLTTVQQPPPAIIQAKYRVTLTDAERADLTRLVTTGQSAARVIAHAHVLLRADTSAPGPSWTDEQIRTAFGLSLTTIARIRRRFVDQGVDAALYRQPFRTLRPRKLDGRAEAHLVALACSAPPEGRARWTLQLLTDHLVALGVSDPISDETVRRVLKKKRAQAVAAPDVGAADCGEWGVRGGDGGHPRRL
jgi:transposase